MDFYYLKYYPDEDGVEKKNEVHRQGCPRLNGAFNTIYLGYFSSCGDAIEHAKRIFPYIADLCRVCCPEFRGGL